MCVCVCVHGRDALWGDKSHAECRWRHAKGERRERERAQWRERERREEKSVVERDGAAERDFCVCACACAVRCVRRVCGVW